jgi:hypothetical protein
MYIMQPPDPFEEGVMDRDVTRTEEISPRQQDRDDDVLKRLELDAEVPVRRHRRREYPGSDEG